MRATIHICSSCFAIQLYMAYSADEDVDCNSSDDGACTAFVQTKGEKFHFRPIAEDNAAAQFRDKEVRLASHRADAATVGWWFLSNTQENCDDACAREDLACWQEDLALGSRDALEKVLDDIGYNCSSWSSSQRQMALWWPGRQLDGACIMPNATYYPECSVKHKNVQRLCFCKVAGVLVDHGTKKEKKEATALGWR